MNFVYPNVINQQDPSSSLVNSVYLNITKDSLNLPANSIYQYSANEQIRCQNCNVIFTKKTFLSELSQCYLCGQDAKIEFPKNHPTQKKETFENMVFIPQNPERKAFNNEILLIILLDTSSSMIASYYNNGRFMPRIEVCLNALQEALPKLDQKRFRYRICFITFDEKVQIYGDLSKKNPEIFDDFKNANTPEKLFAWPKGKIQLRKNGLSDFLKEFKIQFKFDKEMEISGKCTSLGEAMAIALGIIEEYKQKELIDKSQIIVLTDNFSNNGILDFREWIDVQKQEIPDVKLKEDWLKMVRDEYEYDKVVNEIYKKMKEISTSFSFFFFEEPIALKLIIKLMPDYDFYRGKVKTISAKVQKEISLNGKKVIVDKQSNELTLDLEDFYLNVENSFKKFENILGLNANLTIYMSPNLTIVRRDSNLNESEITPGMDLLRVIHDIGMLCPMPFSFSFNILDPSMNKRNVTFHLELRLDDIVLDMNGGQFLNEKIFIWEKNLEVEDEGALQLNKININTLINCFKIQKLWFCDSEAQNLLIILCETNRKNEAEEIQNELEKLSKKFPLNNCEEKARDRLKSREEKSRIFTINKDKNKKVLEEMNDLMPTGSSILKASQINCSIDNANYVPEDEDEDDDTLLVKKNLLNVNLNKIKK